MLNYLKQKSNFILAALVFCLAAIVYLFTLAPTVGMEDSSEFVTAAYTLGIPHPPGFPLYVLLAKLFTFIPLGTIAWRVNFMSAFWGALTVGLLYWLMEKITQNKLVAFSGSLILAFSSIFWAQSVVAEVYALNSFFVVLLILILWQWSQTGKNKYLWWFAFLYGLSLTNHTMMSLLAPIFAVYIILVKPAIIKKWKLILIMFILFCLGFSVYLYLPLRSIQQPLLDTGHPNNFAAFLAHITRQSYNDFAPQENLYSKLGLVLSFFVTLYEQFFWPTLILALAGLFWLARKNFKLMILTLGVFFLNSLGIIFLRTFGYGIGVEYCYRVYYLPCFIVLIIWLGVILNYLYQRLELCKSKNLIFWRFCQAIFFILILSLPLNFLISNYRSNDLSDFWFNYDYAKNVLTSLEPNSILFFAYDGTFQADTEIFTYSYLKMVENIRPDVTIVDDLGLFYKSVRLNLPKEYSSYSLEKRQENILSLLSLAKDRPLYTNFVVTQKDTASKFFSRSNGIIYKIYSDPQQAYQDKTFYLPAIRNLSQAATSDQISTAGLLGHYDYNLAAFYLSRGNSSKSQQYLIQAFNLDQSPFTHEYRQFLEYRKEWLNYAKK